MSSFSKDDILLAWDALDNAQKTLVLGRIAVRSFAAFFDAPRSEPETFQRYFFRAFRQVNHLFAFNEATDVAKAWFPKVAFEFRFLEASDSTADGIDGPTQASFPANSAISCAKSVHGGAYLGHADIVQALCWSAGAIGIRMYNFNEVGVRLEDIPDELSPGPAMDDMAFLENHDVNDLRQRPLWIEQNYVPPQSYTFLTDPKHIGPHFEFWGKWYQGFLDGKPLDLELQKRVALIPDDVWESGVGAVAEAIRGIEANYLAEQSPLAENVFYNDETARVTRTTIPQARPKTMATMLAALRDDLEDASSGNLLSKTSYDYRTLDRMMTKYHLNPERVEMDVVKISGSLRRQIDAGDLPDAPEVEGLCSTLVEIGLEIRAQHPEIDEARSKRGLKAVQEACAEERDDILAGLGMIRTVVEEEFADEIIEDLEEIVEAGDSVPDTDATSRSGNRLAKIWLVLKKTVAGSGIAAGAVVAINEALPILQTLWQIMSRLLGLG